MNTIDPIVEIITINAPPARVFEALVSPEQRLKWWWSSEGRFKLTHVESDLRPGGKWHMRGVGMEGKEMNIAGEYLEVDRPRVLSFTWLPDWQPGAPETVVRWELEETAGVTTVRLTHSGFTSAESKAAYRGWQALLGGLKSYIDEAV